MQKNSVKRIIQQLGEDYWFEIYTKDSIEPIVDGRECYNSFEEYYNKEVQKVIIEFPNNEELQIIKLYIK